MELNKFIKNEKLIWVLFGILIPFKGTPVYEENKDKLYKYEYRRTDGTHILMKPKYLPKILFKLEYNFLYYINYPRIYWAGISNTFNKKYKNDGVSDEDIDDIFIEKIYKNDKWEEDEADNGLYISKGQIKCIELMKEGESCQELD